MNNEKTPTPQTQPLVQRKGGGGSFFGGKKNTPSFFQPAAKVVAQQKQEIVPDEQKQLPDPLINDLQTLPNDSNAEDNNANSDTNNDADSDNNNHHNNQHQQHQLNDPISIVQQKQSDNKAIQAKLLPILGQIVQKAPAPAAGTTKLNAANISSAMFNGTVITSQKSGNVSLEDTMGSELKVKSPVIEIVVDAGLKSGIELDTGVAIEAGPIQTMTVSDRTGVYRHGGKGGDILFQQRIVKPLSRDAAKNTDGGGYPPPPWYYRPQNPNAQANVKLHDEPWFALPKRIGNGVLTEIKGTSEFVSSIAVRVIGTENLVHLYQFKWSVSWDMEVESKIDINTLQEDFSSSGGKGIIFNDKTTETPTALKDTKVANEIDNAKWIIVPNVAAAMQLHHRQLIPNIISAKANGDTLSAQHCIEALKAKNPALQINVYVNEAQSITTKDTVKATANSAGKSAVSNTAEANDDELARLTIPLLDAVDIEKMNGSSQIEFTIEPIGKQITWAFPWASAGMRHFKESSAGARDYDYDVELKL